jgi:hypothetical protein
MNLNAVLSLLRTAACTSSSLRMVEKVEVDVVSPGPKKAAFDAKTSEFVSSAKEVADQFKVSSNALFLCTAVCDNETLAHSVLPCDQRLQFIIVVSVHGIELDCVRA